MLKSTQEIISRLPPSLICLFVFLQVLIGIIIWLIQIPIKLFVLWLISVFYAGAKYLAAKFYILFSQRVEQELINIYKKKSTHIKQDKVCFCNKEGNLSQN